MKILDDKLLELRAVPELYDFVFQNCFIAGGAVRDTNAGRKPKDYDLFFRTAEAIAEFKERFAKYCTATALDNYNWGEFQFITLYYGTPANVVSTFDWNVNQQYYEFGTAMKVCRWATVAGSIYLRFNVDARKPLSAFLRLPYMLEKGYKIEAEEMMFMFSFISQFKDLKADLSEEFEFMSSGGGFIGSDKAENAVKRATAEVYKKTTLGALL